MTTSGVGASNDIVQEAMRRFLVSTTTGCEFASRHAKRSGGHLSWLVLQQKPDESAVSDIDAFFDGCAANEHAAIVVFPVLRSAADLVDLLGVVSTGARWTMHLPDWKKHARPDVLVGLHWRTNQQTKTSVMGMGPLGTMPLHRRSPFFAFVVWPGGHSNPHRQSQPPTGRVSLIDMPLHATMSRPDYEKMFETTRKNTRRIADETEEGAARPDVAFCLPGSLAKEIRAVASAGTKS